MSFPNARERNFVVSLISDVSTHLTILLINKTIINCTNTLDTFIAFFLGSGDGMVGGGGGGRKASNGESTVQLVEQINKNSRLCSSNNGHLYKFLRGQSHCVRVSVKNHQVNQKKPTRIDRFRKIRLNKMTKTLNEPEIGALK